LILHDIVKLHSQNLFCAGIDCGSWIVPKRCSTDYKNSAVWRVCLVEDQSFS